MVSHPMRLRATATPIETAAALPCPSLAPTATAAAGTTAVIADELSAVMLTLPPASTVLSSMNAFPLPRIRLSAIAPPPLMATPEPSLLTPTPTAAAMETAVIDEVPSAETVTLPLGTVTVAFSMLLVSTLAISFRPTETPTAMPWLESLPSVVRPTATAAPMALPRIVEASVASMLRSPVPTDTVLLSPVYAATVFPIRLRQVTPVIAMEVAPCLPVALDTLPPTPRAKIVPPELAESSTLCAAWTSEPST